MDKINLINLKNTPLIISNTFINNTIPPNNYQVELLITGLDNKPTIN
jgi:hypothetical protein